MIVSINVKTLLSRLTAEEQTDCILEAYDQCCDTARYALFAEAIHDIPTALLEKELLERECRYRKIK